MEDIQCTIMEKIFNTPNSNYQKIFFENIETIISIGIHDFEKVKKQKVLISIELTVNISPADDSISTTLDYDQILEFVLKIANNKHFNLQETLCNEIANFCLSKPQVVAVKVITKKVDVYQNCDAVGFEIFISKDEKKIK